jgi:beta-glucanase (GH16 family)
MLMTCVGIDYWTSHVTHHVNDSKNNYIQWIKIWQNHVHTHIHYIYMNDTFSIFHCIVKENIF